MGTFEYEFNGNSKELRTKDVIYCRGCGWEATTGTIPEQCLQCASSELEIARQEVTVFLRRRIASTDSAVELAEELSGIARIVNALTENGWELREPIVSHAHFVKVGDE